VRSRKVVKGKRLFSVLLQAFGAFGYLLNHIVFSGAFYLNAATATGILGSKGFVRESLDNAIAESFFATLQTELLGHKLLANAKRTPKRHLRIH
jgi:transposase InsO family protein